MYEKFLVNQGLCDCAVLFSVKLLLFMVSSWRLSYKLNWRVFQNHRFMHLSLLEQDMQSLPLDLLLALQTLSVGPLLISSSYL